MLKRATARSKASAAATNAAAKPADASLFHATDPIYSNTPQDERIERVRLKIPHAHVFKLPPKPSSGGWRGADWRDKVWQGTLKIVERGEETAVLLVDGREERNIFAVCPIMHDVGGGNGNAGNGIDRCIDSSRYFVLRIQNAQGRHMYIGLAFNERNDAFDFNTALEDSRREKDLERRASLGGIGVAAKGVDYKMKAGEKIHVSIPKLSTSGSGEDGTSPSNNEATSGSSRRREARKARQSSINASGGFLKPSMKDTPSRLA